VIRNRSIETQTRKPPVRKVQTDFVEQSPFARDAMEIPDEQDAQQNFRID